MAIDAGDGADWWYAIEKAECAELLATKISPTHTIIVLPNK
jgi:hypothetical protein